jgi:hypothetical protein
MTVIRIEELNSKEAESSYFNELTPRESEITRGGIFPIIAALYLGYCIGEKVANKTK